MCIFAGSLYVLIFESMLVLNLNYFVYLMHTLPYVMRSMHRQAMRERGVCELSHFFCHFNLCVCTFICQRYFKRCEILLTAQVWCSCVWMSVLKLKCTHVHIPLSYLLLFIKYLDVWFIVYACCRFTASYLSLVLL